MFHLGDTCFDPAARRLWRGAREIRVTRKAFDLLSLLIERRPDAVSKDDIHARLWPETFVADITLHSLVSELRSALGDEAGSPRFIRTVHGFGYALVSPVEESSSAHAAARPLRGWLIGDAGRLSLFDGSNVLGRGVADAIDLPSPTISRRHAAIRFEDAAWLEDLDSKNGTFVDDARVTRPVRLADGDRVRLGSLLFTFRVAHGGAVSTQSETHQSARRRSKPGSAVT